MSYALFFTDPHLGKHLQSHTTPSSRERLRHALFAQVKSFLHSVEGNDSFVYCLGDLFDKFSNKEETILQGYEILTGVTACIAGNHDLIADVQESSTLQLLDSLMGDNSPVTLCSTLIENPHHKIYLVAHQVNQAEFESVLEGLIVDENDPRTKVLCLHCNYDSDFATQEISLNLTKERAQFLLQKFDYILIGHEHNASVHFGGRLIVMGNTHPTSFHDISDKFIWELRKGKFEKKQIYAAADHYWQPTVEEFLDTEGWPDKQLHWIRISGQLDTQHAVEFAGRVKEAWRVFPSLFALRVDAKALTEQGTEGVDAEGFLKVMNQITAEVEGMGDVAVLSLYQEICEEIRLEKEKQNVAQD